MMKKKRANEIIRLAAARMGLGRDINLLEACHFIAEKIGVDLPRGYYVSVKTRIMLARVISNPRREAENKIENSSVRSKPSNVITFKKKIDCAPSEAKIKAFYKSWDWKQLRYDFLKKSERRCQCCGATPEDGVRIVVDHVKPIRIFWHLRLDINNLQALCNDCNMGKGSRDETRWEIEQATPEQEERLLLIKQQLGESC